MSDIIAKDLVRELREATFGKSLFVNHESGVHPICMNCFTKYPRKHNDITVYNHVGNDGKTCYSCAQTIWVHMSDCTCWKH